MSPDVPAALDSIVAHALDPEPAGRYPNGQAFASALESLVAHADPSSPTVATDQAALAAAAAALAHGAPSSVGVAPPMPASVAPLRPASAGPAGRVGLATAQPPGLGAVRRASPVIAAPLMVLMLVVGVVVAALLLAALPGGGSTGVAFASPTPRATQRPTARPTARPSARPSATVPGATAIAKPASTPIQASGPKPPSPGTLDACDPFFGVACGLDAGLYEPSHFVPPIRFKLGAWLVGLGFAIGRACPDAGRGPSDVRQRDHDRLPVSRPGERAGDRPSPGRSLHRD